jgi:hypothetical protein
MTAPRLFKPLVALAALTLFLILPAAAQATIAFVRGNVAGTVYTSGDNGKGVQKIGKGSTPHVSPDGASVVYDLEGPNTDAEMKITAADGSSGAGKTLMKGWREPFVTVWSPNSEYVLAERGGEIGIRKLVLITVATGAQKVLASGYFSGFSFDPEGKEIVYAKSNVEKFPPHSDVFRVPVAGGKAVALTHDHLSMYPVWGPSGKIVFVKLVEGNKRKYAPKNELYLMNPQGQQVKRLTHTKVDELLQGLFPTAWSGNGKTILAQFGGQDTTYAVAVDAQSGAQKPVLEATEQGLEGSAISFDGRTVFGSDGGFEPGPQRTVVSVTGGKSKVLAAHAYTASFGG